ncbi:DUF916 domain-containing protein [Plantactinospora sp. S1510]|uniref:DUF916 domain-containing protein n=1 Tax=Plantactinospora alkalitolerans TaxID=2789879 RepID=A0ABS0GZ82_9ACTN|nr:DUF916 domain-containing protein [Plantactinospora alkalitolerans]MBF9131507.1 DUF916 domain-containing protein [Plantactinospora alkalitolerans]
MHAPVTRRKTNAAALLRTAALALLAVFAVTGLTAGPAQAADGDVAWTVRTASNSFGADRSSFSYAANPGGMVEDAMVVANHSAVPLDLAVYAADGFTTDAGQLDLLAKDGRSLGIGAWVHATGGKVRIQPGKTADVPFKVTVPANATPGDYVGGIVTSLTQPDAAEGINVDRRLGIRIKLRVGGELKPNLAIDDLHVNYDGSANPFGKGDATITYRIHNTGNTTLSAQQTLSVSGPFGWLRVEAGEIASPPDLLPGESWNVTVPVHGVAPALRLAATATLTPVLTDPSGSTTSLEPVRATTHGWAAPWPLLLLLVVLVVLAAGAFLLARRSRLRRKSREDARVRKAVEKAIRDKSPQGG